MRSWPEWSGGEGAIHLVFTARRGLPPAVRAFIDYLVEELPKALSRCEEVRSDHSAPPSAH